MPPDHEYVNEKTDAMQLAGINGSSTSTTVAVKKQAVAAAASAASAATSSTTNTSHPIRDVFDLRKSRYFAFDHK